MLSLTCTLVVIPPLETEPFELLAFDPLTLVLDTGAIALLAPPVPQDTLDPVAPLPDTVPPAVNPVLVLVDDGVFFIPNVSVDTFDSFIIGDEDVGERTFLLIPAITADETVLLVGLKTAFPDIEVETDTFIWLETKTGAVSISVGPVSPLVVPVLAVVVLVLPVDDTPGTVTGVILVTVLLGALAAVITVLAT